MSSGIADFKMPRYADIPSIGLYLDQTVKYINEIMLPLGCVEVTPSMVSNYVKKKYISKPVKKLYSREQIAILMVVALAKLVLGMDQIEVFLKFNECREPDGGMTYDLFCRRFETTLMYIFGKKGSYRDEFFSVYENDGYTSLSRKEVKPKTSGIKPAGAKADGAGDDSAQASLQGAGTAQAAANSLTGSVGADPAGNPAAGGDSESGSKEAGRTKAGKSSQSKAEEEDRMLNSLMIAVAHCIYINYCLTKLAGAKPV